MAQKGRKRRLELEAACWELVRLGIGTVRACSEVGIGRTTGSQGGTRTAVSRRAGSLAVLHSGRFVSQLERHASVHWMSWGVREIARRMNRALTTISSELLTNHSARVTEVLKATCGREA